MISNNQHHFDSAVSLVNFIRPGEPGWQPLFWLPFKQQLTVWHANTLSHASCMPYQQSLALPPYAPFILVQECYCRSLCCEMPTVKACWHVLYCLKTMKWAAYINNMISRPYCVQNVTMKSFSAFNSSVATTFHSTHTYIYIHGTPLLCSTVLQ
jgi:hypothetical protein